MAATRTITSPDDAALGQLCAALSAQAPSLDASGTWPAEQLRLCGEYGVYQWFAGREWGGQAWNQEDILRGYLALSSACLTTTFILAQRDGACRRIESSDNWQLKEELLPKLTRGALFATVGISHLTTSRLHLTTPVLRAETRPDGYLLDGYSPWVTGADHADYVVTGATLTSADGSPAAEQLLAAIPTGLPGVRAGAPAELLGLSASHTGPLHFDGARIDEGLILAGPVENVMSVGAGAGTGGLGTTTLALGLSQAAIEYLAKESLNRPDLAAPHEALTGEAAELEADLFAGVRGQPACSNDELRQRANSLVLRSTQAALAAAKGAGYVAGHPAGRWCREALFFLVWSCPQPVLAANLCELAGILD